MIDIKKIFTKLLNLDYYTSPTDKFLHKYDRAHTELSASQQKEIAKSNKISHLRNQTNTNEKTKETLWDKF